MKDKALPIALLALLVGAWEAAAHLFGIENYLLPAPSEVARALVQDRGLLAPDTWVTAREVIFGFGGRWSVVGGRRYDNPAALWCMQYRVIQ